MRRIRFAAVAMTLALTAIVAPARADTADPPTPQDIGSGELTPPGVEIPLDRGSAAKVAEALATAATIPGTTSAELAAITDELNEIRNVNPSAVGTAAATVSRARTSLALTGTVTPGTGTMSTSPTCGC